MITWITPRRKTHRSAWLGAVTRMVEVPSSPNTRACPRAEIGVVKLASRSDKGSPSEGRYQRPRGARVKAISETARQVGTLLVIGLVLVAGGACGQSPMAKKQKAVARGEQYLKDGKLNEAIIEFRTALQVDQDFLPAVHALGRAYIAKSWYGDAARELQRAQKLAPDSLPI